MSARICICATQVPFSRGGAEALVDSLRRELARRGHRVDVVALPFAWSPRLQILKSGLAWRLLDLTSIGGEPVDLVIATRFPSYVIRHPNKVVWLVHQFRQVYELLGSRFSDFGDGEADREIIRLVRTMDRRTLAEARGLFTISRNTADRLRRFLDLEATPLYPPPPLDGALRGGEYGDYVLGVGRLDAMKRFDLLVRGLGAARSGIRCILAGEGQDGERLQALARRLGLGDRLELAGRVSDERLAKLYAGARAVFYAPFDEDYGYVTVEAFRAARPVVTCADSGGVLEFVEDGVSGFVCAPGEIDQIGRAFDRLMGDEALCRRMGAAGRAAVADIGWDRVIDGLTATLGR